MSRKSSLAESNIAWLFFGDEEQDNTLKILKEIAQASTVDVLGLGRPIEVISDLFFPGTSTLHTRLRYVVFVSAILYRMRDIVENHGKLNNPNLMLKKCQAKLIDSLHAGLESKGEKLEGIIGASFLDKTTGENNGESLKYPPSVIYWSAVNKFQMLGGEANLNRSAILSQFSNYKKSGLNSSDGDVVDKQIIFPGNPKVHEFGSKLFGGELKDTHLPIWKTKLTFDLERSEAQYFKEKILELYPNSLYPHLMMKSDSQIQKLHSVFDVKTNDFMLNKLIKEAEMFSRFAMGANYAYRWALCDFRFLDIDYDWGKARKHHEKNFEGWFQTINQLKGWKVSELSKAAEKVAKRDLGQLLSPELLRFSEDILKVFSEHKDPLKVLKKSKEILIDRENRMKGSRSKFKEEAKEKISVPQFIVKPDESLEKADEFYFGYRWWYGQQNAIDILKGLKRRG